MPTADMPGRMARVPSGRLHEQQSQLLAPSQVDLATTVPAPAIRQRDTPATQPLARPEDSPLRPIILRLLASLGMSFGRGFTLVAVILGVIAIVLGVVCAVITLRTRAFLAESSSASGEVVGPRPARKLRRGRRRASELHHRLRATGAVHQRRR